MQYHSYIYSLKCGKLWEILMLQIPGPVRRWIDQICAWDFTRVISAHFNAPVDATPADLR